MVPQKLSVVSSNPFAPKATKRAPVKRQPNPRFQLARSVGGGLLGVSIPLSAHTLVHSQEFDTSPRLFWIVVACLAYSAPTVCQWAASFTVAGTKTWQGKALGWVKAFGFVGCLEGVLVAAPESCAWLSWMALILLMGINSVILATKTGR